MGLLSCLDKKSWKNCQPLNKTYRWHIRYFTFFWVNKGSYTFWLGEGPKESEETKIYVFNNRNNVFPSWSLISPKYSSKDLLNDQKLQIHIIHLYIHNICNTNIKSGHYPKSNNHLHLWQNSFASLWIKIICITIILLQIIVLK